jgi:hypothetical protein
MFIIVLISYGLIMALNLREMAPRYLSAPLYEQERQCTRNVTFRRVRLMFVPPRLSEGPDTISLEDRAFMKIFCRQKQ